MPESVTRRRVVGVAGAAVGLAGLGGTVGSTGAQPAPDTYPVQTVGLQFVPEVLTVPAGATVEWLRPQPAIEHSVTSAATMADAATGQHNDSSSEAFDESLPPTGTVQLTFNIPGRYPYFCRPHYPQGMVGQIVVGGT